MIGLLVCAMYLIVYLSWGVMNANKEVQNGEGIKSFVVIFLSLVTISLYVVGVHGLNFNELGPDLPTYYRHYLTYIHWSLSDFLHGMTLDPGYEWYSYILAKLSAFVHGAFSMPGYFSVSLLIMMGLVYGSAKRFVTTGEAVIVALMYLPFSVTNLFMFNLVRQGIAVAVGFYAVFLLEKHTKLVFGFILAFIAWTMHSSVVYMIFLPYFVVKAATWYLENQTIKRILYALNGIGILLYVSRTSGMLFGRLPIGFIQKYQSPAMLQQVKVNPTLAGYSTHYLIYGLIVLVAILALDLANRKQLTTVKKGAEVLCNLTLLILAEFFVLGFLPYSYRILETALFMIPLLYAIVQKSNHLWRTVIVLLAIAILVQGWPSSPFSVLGG
ncbi:MAG: EpsG family protein [Weissella confusa]